MEVYTILIGVIFATLVGFFVGMFVIVRRVHESYCLRKLGDKKSMLPPGDMGWPVIGNTLSIFRALSSTNPDSILGGWRHKYGKAGIYKTHLFRKPCIVLCTADACHQLLMDNQRFVLGFPIGPIKKLMGVIGNNNVSHTEHNRLRRAVVPPMSSYEALSTYIEPSEAHVVSTLEEWAASSLDGPIEFVPEMKRLLFKCITRVFLGSDSPSSLGELERIYNEIVQGAFCLPVDFPGFTFHKALKARTEWLEIFKPIVEDRKRRKTNRAKECLLDIMMELKDDEGKEYDDVHLVDMLLTFLIGGHESTAIVAAWVTIYLHQHPDTLLKAKEEQEEIIRRRPPTQKGLSLNEIRQMEYLRKAIDETLRVIHPSLILFREALEDVEINGYLIPKGWRLICWPRALHMDPTSYPNPKMFDPSRWDNNKAQPAAYIPFGAGNTICPGADLTKFFIFVFHHYFLSNYKLELLDPFGKCKYFPIQEPADSGLAKIKKLK